MSWQTFLQSKLATVILIGALGFVMLLSGRLIIQKQDVQKEIRTLESKADQIQKDNQDLSQLINYLNTNEYKERQAREQLNLKKEGEFVVAFPKESEGGDEDKLKENLPNSKKWFNYLFEANSN